MLKIRRSRDRLIFNMGIPIPGKDGLYIEAGAWILVLAMTSRGHVLFEKETELQKHEIRFWREVAFCVFFYDK